MAISLLLSFIKSLIKNEWENDLKSSKSVKNMKNDNQGNI